MLTPFIVCVSYKNFILIQDNLGDMTQPGNIYNPNLQQVTLSRNEPSPSYNLVTTNVALYLTLLNFIHNCLSGSCLQDSNRNTLQQYAQGPSDRHMDQMYHGSNFQQ
jgi:hypothetical protein